jgi:glycosyltransferase involved in cell wall biosynthesis
LRVESPGVVSPVPAVSIAIRGYRRRWIEGAIASVLGQSWRDLELVVYDDAGDLADLVAALDDGRVRYVRAREKLGASGRYKAAVALCSGRYIGVLDDDDRYEPRFVERLIGVLENDPRAGVAFCRSMRDSGGIRIEEIPAGQAGLQAGVVRKILVEQWILPTSLMLLRRAALDESEVLHFIPDGVAPDVFVNFHLALAGWHHLLVDEVLVVRGWHDEQLSRSLAAIDHGVATYEHLHIEDPELDRLRREEVARHLIRRAFHHLRAGRRQDATEDLRAARESAVSVDRVARWLVGLGAHAPVFGPLAARLTRVVKRWTVGEGGGW